MPSPTAVLTLRTFLFTAWALLLAAAGLVLLHRSLSGVVDDSWIGRQGFWIGIAGLCAGQFIFMAAVADRLFPAADRRISGAGEAVVFLSLLAAVAGVLFA
ncbi:MAG: hypothetical protein K2Y21_15750 [Phycisphaerales bacterium]|nr:hypothetical protein [Phycisphaerales bacterium]